MNHGPNAIGASSPGPAMQSEHGELQKLLSAIRERNIRIIQTTGRVHKLNGYLFGAYPTAEPKAPEPTDESIINLLFVEASRQYDLLAELDDALAKLAAL